MRLTGAGMLVVLWASATLLADEVADKSLANWPQWRGPQRDARSTETGLLQQWPEGGPPLLWRSAGFGAGYSSLAVAGGRIFTMGDIGEDQFLIAASTANGEILWKQRIGPAWVEEMFGGARGTPTVDGDRVYALGTDGDLLCADAKSGKPLWRRSKAPTRKNRAHLLPKSWLFVIFFCFCIY